MTLSGRVAYRRANMYVKRYVFQRGPKRYAYLRLVQAFRDDSGKVRHRVVATLGREDELKASGQLDQLAASFARLDPPRIRSTHRRTWQGRRPPH